MSCSYTSVGLLEGVLNHDLVVDLRCKDVLTILHLLKKTSSLFIIK